MKPLICPQDFLENDVCAMHFVGWRKSGMPAVYEVSHGNQTHPSNTQHPWPIVIIPLSDQASPVALE